MPLIEGCFKSGLLNDFLGSNVPYVSNEVRYDRSNAVLQILLHDQEMKQR